MFDQLFAWGGRKAFGLSVLAGTKKTKCMEWLCTGREKKMKTK